MKKQCEGCYKRFEVIRDSSIPISRDAASPKEAINCPWCGCENGSVEKGSIISTHRCISESEF